MQTKFATKKEKLNWNIIQMINASNDIIFVLLRRTHRLYPKSPKVASESQGDQRLTKISRTD